MTTRKTPWTGQALAALDALWQRRTPNAATSSPRLALYLGPTPAVDPPGAPEPRRRRWRIDGDDDPGGFRIG